MENCSGGDLGTKIEHQRSVLEQHFEEEAIWRYVIQLCQGMKHLHDKRILHRDIKAQNIFLGDSDNIKIGDLGLGRMLGPESVMAVTGVGTPLYFSPELCQDKPYNHKSDIWALGILFYELTALELPFVASNQAALALKIVQDEPMPLPEHYSAELRFLIIKMLEKDMDHRPCIDDILGYNAVRSRIDRAKAKELQSRLADQYADLEEDLRDAYEAKMDELEHVAINMDLRAAELDAAGMADPESDPIGRGLRGLSRVEIDELEDTKMALSQAN